MENTSKKQLSIEQVNAIKCEDKNILVSAGPGSGKTVVIVNRVYNLIKNKNISPRNIIVITFTKAAATNMRNRYLKLAGDGTSPFFGTFHGLCYKILKSFYGEINIIEGWESFKVVKSFLTTYMEEVSDDRIKDYMNAMAILKSRGDYENRKGDSIDKEILKGCLSFYEHYKKEKGLLDFEDLQLMTRDLLRKNSRILSGYRNQFKHILVDEFQDTDDIQVEIIKLLAGENNNLFAVGDEDQCIYSFRGANPSYMVHFKEDFKSGRTLFLSTNYRSKKNVVGLSMKSIVNNSLRTDKKIVPNSTEDGMIKFQGFQNENLQADYVADTILKLKESGRKTYSDFSVLYRTNIESRAIIDSFIKKRIPFLLLDRPYNFFSHFICQDLLAYLKLSIYPMDMDSFLRIINKPFRYISKSSIESVKRDSGLSSVLSRLRDTEGIPVFQMKAIDKLETDINSLNRISLVSAIEFIIGDLGYHKYLQEYSSKYKSSIEDLENILNEFKEAAKEFKTIDELLNHVAEVESETVRAEVRKREKADAVILSTIHGVKGMEFETVFIINVVDGYIPYKDNDMEEERRLFYVGVTRAINNVFFTAPRQIRGETVPKSKFLEEVDLDSEALERKKFKAGARVNHDFYGKGTITELSGNDISIKFSDMTRKFDFMVVVNNGLIELID